MHVHIDTYTHTQVLRYEANQHYTVHHDYGVEDIHLACGPRILTFFLYLSDVEEGGETFFPQINGGVKVTPKRGRAVLWPSVLDEDVLMQDTRTTHAALPVKRGLKLAANAWLHLYDYSKPNLWGCTGSFDELG
ncbi:2OG-Fe(II) oxygenase [archaeon]|nr:MAG: 2OG-Fe(II) oxygenase [archaeon]